VIASRSGLVTHYDPLVQIVAELERTLQVLEDPPQYLDADTRASLRANVAELQRALEDAKVILERFKASNAILRNSLHYFPVAAADTLASLSGDAGESARRAVDAVLVFTLLPESELASTATTLLDALLALEMAPPATKARVANLVEHGRLILQEKPKVDAAVRDILALPGEGLAESLATNDQRAYEAARRAESRRQTMLFALLLGLVVLGAADVITRTKRSARALETAREKLQHALDAEREATQLTNFFVSMASHDLRTPLTVIHQSQQLLQEHGDKFSREKTQTHYARMGRQIKVMTELLDQILLIERGELLKLQCEPVDLDELTERTVQDACGASAQPGQKVQRTYEGPPGPVRLDARLVGHVLGNLLSNALKYSKKDVRLRVEDAGDEVAFVVEDDGIGIPPDDLPRLFGRFHRAANVGSIPGTGLGLAIVKLATEAHGGRVTVDSTLGEGTKFSVWLEKGGAPS
jgi:signal transduction histidine kinase